MINKKRLLLPVLLSSVSICIEAQTLSDEMFKNIGGNRVWQIEVGCERSTQLLNKVVGSEQWCINGSNTCFTDKQIAAEQACQSSDSTVDAGVDDDYEEEEGDELAIDYDGLRKEKQTLEIQSLDIQQKILELTKQELALKKRLSDLK